MQRFLKKLSFFLVLLVIIDFCLGKGLDYLKSHAKGGSTYENEYIANECAPEILILGSSRAWHHYNPSVISDSTGFTCYNAGMGGRGILFGYARFSMVTERRNPKIVIFDIAPIFDYIVEGKKNYSKHIGTLKPYYNHKGTKEVLDRASSIEDSILLNLSSLYCYNSRILPVIVDSLVSRSKRDDGFQPLSRIMDNREVEKEITDSEFKIDLVKLFFLEKLVYDCKQEGIVLIFTVSPIYKGELSDSYRPAVELAQKYDIPFWNYVSAEGISDNNRLFQDRTHMNKDGAKLYSEMIATRLKNIIVSGSQM